MSEWKYIDSIVELSDFESAHCDTRDFCMGHHRRTLGSINQFPEKESSCSGAMFV